MKYINIVSNVIYGNYISEYYSSLSEQKTQDVPNNHYHMMYIYQWSIDK